MQNQKLLVIDDSQDIHGLVTIWLMDEPLEFHAAFDGPGGLAMAREIRPDLILLDVDMPGSNGFDVCAELKKHEATRDIPIVFLTGASNTMEKLRGLEMGAIDYIIKPFDPAELRARVRASLRTKQLLDLLEQKALFLQESEERFRVLAENSSDIISSHSADGMYLYVSPACEPVLGYAPAEMIDRTLCSFVHPDDVQKVTDCYIGRDCARGATRVEPTTFRFLRKDGGYIWLEFSFRLVPNETGGLGEIHASARDITQRKRAEGIEQDRAAVLEMVAQNRPLTDVIATLLNAAEQLYPDSVADSVVLFDGALHHPAGRLRDDIRTAMDHRLYTFTARFCNEAAAGKDDVIVSDIQTDPVWEGIRDAALANGLHTCWSALIRSGRDDVLGMFCLYHRRKMVPDDIAVSFLRMAGKLITVAVEHHQLTEQMAYRAQHDSLTGLPNRVLFEDRLQQALLQAGLNGRQVAIAFLDVDRFKNINDTLGHHAGDVMLCRLVARIMEGLGKTDTLARMGGDEFAMILPELTDPAAVERFGESLVKSFKLPLDVVGQELFVTLSMGMALYPTDGADSISLQKNADAALYAAKNAGRDRSRRFTAEMNHGMRERLDLENALRRAADKGELRLFYQPKVDASDRLVGLEALLRWHHPLLGQIPPNKFIPLAEETGLIVPIGNWVLNEAMRQAQAWAAAGLPRVPVAVNVSALQFAQPDFEQILSNALSSHSLPPRWLELELTESLLMKNMHDAKTKLEQLKQIGVDIAIDDFGTGYSSLAYLQQLPIDVLKIDRAFVMVIRSLRAPTKGRDETAVIRSIAALANSLGLGLVAEGVETEIQRELVLNIGCPTMQGYLYSPARPPAEIEALLRVGILKRTPVALAS